MFKFEAVLPSLKSIKGALGRRRQLLTDNDMGTTAYNGISSSVDTHTDTEQAVEYGYLANEEMQHQLHVRYDTEADVDEETRGNVNNVLAGLNIVYDESSGLLGIVKDQNDGRALRSSDDNKSDGGKDKKKTD